MLWRTIRTPRIGEPLLIFAATRSALFLLAFVAQVVIPFHSGSDRGPFPSNYFLDGWVRWDANWYLQIAGGGYTFDPKTHGGSIAFFPLYPLLIGLLGQVIGSLPLAGIILSNLFFAAALVVLYRLVARSFDREVARLTLVLLCSFPFALFFAAVYTESLFLFLSVLTFELAEQRRWWLSGLAGMLGALTRSVGGFLGPALFLVYLRDKGYQPRRLDRDLFAAGLAPLGSALYLAYLAVRFGDPLAFAKASLYAWGRYDVFAAGPARLNPLTWNTGNYDLVLGMNFCLAVFWLLLTIPTFRRLGPGYALFLFCAVVVPLSAQTESLGRFTAVLFPGFIVLAVYLRGTLAGKLAIAGSAMLLGVLTALFVNWYWVV